MAATERVRSVERNRARRPPPQVAAKALRPSSPDSPELLFGERTATVHASPKGPAPRLVQASLL